MERLRMKNLLLACTVVLGLQFCFPVALRAGDANPVAELISLATKDAESDADASSALALSAPFFLALVLHPRSDAPLGLRMEDDDREHPSLLPVAGLYPSAP